MSSLRFNFFPTWGTLFSSHLSFFFFFLIFFFFLNYWVMDSIIVVGVANNVLYKNGKYSLVVLIN